MVLKGSIIRKQVVIAMVSFEGWVFEWCDLKCKNAKIKECTTSFLKLQGFHGGFLGFWVLEGRN